jgi:hypothetical protein
MAESEDQVGGETDAGHGAEKPWAHRGSLPRLTPRAGCTAMGVTNGPGRDMQRICRGLRFS